MSNTQPIQQHKVIASRIKIQQGHKSDVLKENAKTLNNKYYATKQGYKTQGTEKLNINLYKYTKVPKALIKVLKTYSHEHYNHIQEYMKDYKHIAKN